MGSPLTFFSSERPHVQLHSVPLHRVGPLVQSCHGEKNVTYKDLETTSAAFLVFCENLLFKYQVAPALPWVLTGMNAVWDLDVFNFYFLLINKAHKIFSYSSYKTGISASSESRKLGNYSLGDRKTFKVVNQFLILLYFCLDSDCLVYFLDFFISCAS